MSHCPKESKCSRCEKHDLAGYAAIGTTLSILPIIYRNTDFYYWSFLFVPFGVYLMYRYITLMFNIKNLYKIYTVYIVNLLVLALLTLGLTLNSISFTILCIYWLSISAGISTLFFSRLFKII
jgi:hypothetical protein